MTDPAVIEDARREQVLPDAMPSPDIRLPLAAVEPEQRGEHSYPKDTTWPPGAAEITRLCWNLSLLVPDSRPHFPSD